MSSAPYQHCHCHPIQSPNILLENSKENEILNLTSSHPILLKSLAPWLKALIALLEDLGFVLAPIQ